MRLMLTIAVLLLANCNPFAVNINSDPLILTEALHPNHPWIEAWNVCDIDADKNATTLQREALRDQAVKDLDGEELTFIGLVADVEIDNTTARVKVSLPGLDYKVLYADYINMADAAELKVADILLLTGKVRKCYSVSIYVNSTSARLVKWEPKR